MSEHRQEDLDRYRELVRPNHGPDYRGIHPNVDDLSDEAVASLMVFQIWVAGERFRELGRVLLAPVERLLGWVDRRFGEDR